MPKGKQNQSVAERLRAEAQEVEKRQRKEAETRLKEVDQQIGPLAQEKTELVAFLGEEQEEPTPAPAPAASQPKRQRRSRKGGTRAEQAVALIKEHPEGISASEIAKALKIKPNYMYRVLADVVKDGEVTKKGREYQPA